MLPPGTFADTVVVVTGGGTGLGRAIGVEFGRLGATVAVASRKQEHREAGIGAVRAAGGEAIGVECDVRDPESVARTFDAIEHDAGTAGVLVNNAAGNFPVLAEESVIKSSEGWSTRQSTYSANGSPARMRSENSTCRFPSPESRRMASSMRSRRGSWCSWGMPRSMPIVRIGICAPRSRTKSNEPEPTSG
jgi:hypothetical protein